MTACEIEPLESIDTALAIDFEPAADGVVVEQKRLTALDLFLRDKLALLSQKSMLAVAIRYATSRWAGLTLYVEDGRVEMDSNTVERSIRPLALTLGGIVFGVVVILAVAIVPAALVFLHSDGLAAEVLDLTRWPVLAAVVVLAFAVIYRYAPSRTHADWRWISWGPGIAAVLWIVGSVIFSFYVSHFGSYSATYGALGAVVVMLLWFWVSAIVLLLGAEIDGEIDDRAREHGSPLHAGISH